MVDTEVARQHLKQAQLGIIEAYLNKISQEYKLLTNEKRREVVNGLEKVVDLIERNVPLETKKKANLGPFNKLDAKVARVKNELTQKQAAEKIGISQGCIAKYESGTIIPTPYKQGKQINARKYLEFLKRLGYNPYNI